MIGKLISCVRCSAAIFLKQVGTDTLDDGYTKMDRFEKLPDSWISTTQFGHLCPECSKMFQENLTYFLGHDNFAPAFKVAEDLTWKPKQLMVYMKEEVTIDES